MKKRRILRKKIIEIILGVTYLVSSTIGFMFAYAGAVLGSPNIAGILISFGISFITYLLVYYLLD